MKIEYLRAFLKQYKKLPSEVKALAEKKEILFRKNPFDPMLETHYLSGPLSDYLTFSINRRYRVVFTFVNKNLVWFHRIGTHKVHNR